MCASVNVSHHKLESFLVLLAAVLARASQIASPRLELFFLFSSLFLLVTMVLPPLPLTFSASFTKTFNLHNVYSLCIYK